jgi:hypothetical protein
MSSDLVAFKLLKPSNKKITGLRFFNIITMLIMKAVEQNILLYEMLHIKE